MQTTSHLLMVRPVKFGYNAQTAVNNSFQIAGNSENVQQLAVKEFDSFVDKLRMKGIDVTVVQDTEEPHTPDSIFPNNWISFHEDCSIVVYPMFAENRREEKKYEVLDAIRNKFTIKRIYDFTEFVLDEVFLEGTGSMVLDRENKIAYACISPRTSETVFAEFCSDMNYTPCSFIAVDSHGAEIYHTNVMMCVADKYVVICMDSIPDTNEKELVAMAIIDSGKKIITITQNQLNHFAGNMLQVHNNEGNKFLVMSTQAYQSLTQTQIDVLSSYNEIIHSPLTTIETNGGGSARCMMAEVFLPVK